VTEIQSPLATTQRRCLMIRWTVSILADGYWATWDYLREWRISL